MLNWKITSDNFGYKISPNKGYKDKQFLVYTYWHKFIIIYPGLTVHLLIDF